MRRRINLGQFRSKIRQAQAKQRQAINRYNQKVRAYNQAVRNLKASLERYNREVRAYNSRQRQNRHRLQAELNRLQRQRSTAYASLRTSASKLQTTYVRLEAEAEARDLTPAENFFLDQSEREAANSAELLNVLLSQDEGDTDFDLQATSITEEIAVISEELDSRWRGALFSLSPRNPEASRHFCSSAREIFAEILSLTAPDDAVFEAMPDCARTERGNATRRSKISFLLSKKGIRLSEAAEFADQDIGNVMELFDLLNAGTHGEAGRYCLQSLAAIKGRVEDGLVFLSRLAA